MGDSAESSSDIISPEDRKNTVAKRKPSTSIKNELVEWGNDNCMVLLDAVEDHINRCKKEHPKKVYLRKHVVWAEVSKIMEERNVPCSADKARSYWLRILKPVQIERSVNEIIDDARLKVRKLCTPLLSTGFYEFRKEWASKLVKKGEHISAVDMSKKTAKRWKKLPDSKRQKYNLMAERANREILISHPSIKRKKATIKLSFELKVSIPADNLHSFFVASRMKTMDSSMSAKERKRIVEKAWREITGPEIKKASQEYDKTKEEFQKYLSSLPKDQRVELENYINKKSLKTSNVPANSKAGEIKSDSSSSE